MRHDGAGVCLGDEPSVFNTQVQSQADAVMKRWTTEQLYDMKWAWKLEHGTLFFESVDLEGSASTFPQRFLNTFVGRERPLVDMGGMGGQPWVWLLSTVSTK